MSAQNKISMVELADKIKEENSAMADFILYSRFADDRGHSGEYRAVLKKLVKAVDNLFGQAGLKYKGWTYSFEDPSPNVKEVDGTVSIGGMRQHDEVDCIKTPVQQPHLLSSRGRLVVGTEVYSGNCLEDLDKFVPKDLIPEKLRGPKFNRSVMSRSAISHKVAVGGIPRNTSKSRLFGENTLAS